METGKQTPVNGLQASIEANSKPGGLTIIQSSKPHRKKHNSALLAAAQYRSPVHQVGCNTYFNMGIEDTGLNIGFRERGDIT
jgi:hypothetical protein